MRKRALILAFRRPARAGGGGRCDRGRRVRRAPKPRRRGSTTSSRQRRRATRSPCSTRQVSSASPSRARVRWGSTCSTRLCSTGTIDADEAGAAGLRAAERRLDEARRARVPRSSSRCRNGRLSPVRPAIRRDQGRQPLRDPGVVGVARLDLEAEPERHAVRLEPAGRLRPRAGSELAPRQYGRWTAAASRCAARRPFGRSARGSPTSTTSTANGVASASSRSSGDHAKSCTLRRCCGRLKLRPVRPQDHVRGLRHVAPARARPRGGPR